MAVGHEYKVLTQADKLFGDAFDPYKLQGVLNELAEKNWRVISVTSGDFGDWTMALTGNKRGQLIVVLEREITKLEAPGNETPRATPESYDASRIPKQRWYANVGNISTMLKNSGAVSQAQLDEARVEFGKRGGHLADHLIALGHVSEDDLRRILGK